MNAYFLSILHILIHLILINMVNIINNNPMNKCYCYPLKKKNDAQSDYITYGY